MDQTLDLHLLALRRLAVQRAGFNPVRPKSTVLEWGTQVKPKHCLQQNYTTRNGSNNENRHLRLAI